MRFISKTKSTSYEVLFVLEAPPRIELGIEVLQTCALPLGHGALWSGLRGSNPPPRPWQGRALPNELNPQVALKEVATRMGLDSRRVLRALVAGGSDMPPACHSVPLGLRILQGAEKCKKSKPIGLLFLARPGGFEPSTYRFVAGHSIH